MKTVMITGVSSGNDISLGKEFIKSFLNGCHLCGLVNTGIAEISPILYVMMIDICKLFDALVFDQLAIQKSIQKVNRIFTV